VDVLDAIARRRMHRSFDRRPVPDELLQQIAAAAARAPMAANIPLRRIVVVTDRRIIATLRQVTPGLSSDPPALIALCTDLAVAEAETGRHGRDISSYIDAGAAAENAALAAAALGLGASFARSRTEAGIGVALGLPPHVRPDILVGVGYVSQRPSRAPRRPETPIFRDQFGAPWSGDGCRGEAAENAVEADMPYRMPDLAAVVKAIQTWRAGGGGTKRRSSVSSGRARRLNLRPPPHAGR